MDMELINQGSVPAIIEIGINQATTNYQRMENEVMDMELINQESPFISSKETVPGNGEKFRCSTYSKKVIEMIRTAKRNFIWKFTII